MERKGLPAAAGPLSPRRLRSRHPLSPVLPVLPALPVVPHTINHCTQKTGSPLTRVKTLPPNPA